MKANEFVKKYGVEEAKRVLHCMDDASEFKTYMPVDTWDKPTLIDAVGLRRLVESHELVESYGGVDKLHEFTVSVWRSNKDDPFIPKAKQAIADVESCYVD